jgi:conjugative relaxase-like TrwC/TraI family protein
VVLKIHVVRPGGHLYYVNDLIPGRAEETLVAGESPGVWTGDGATALGITGAVTAPVFGEVLDGRDPWSGRAMREGRGTRSVSGYDLAFCAPKSVSVLHLLAPGEIAGEVGAGHRAAVAEAVDYLQRSGLGVRRTHGGRLSLLSATGAVAGEFVHRTSRALDPHLHSHLVVANVAQGVDGRWSAVDSRRIFSHARATRGIYHARLRMELSERLGAAWDVRPNGLGDVVGVDAALRRLFSQRSATIDEYLSSRSGGGSGPTRRGAFHATRPDKDRTQTVESLLGAWKQRATESGFDLGDLTRVVGLGRASVPSVEPIDGDRLARRFDQLEQRHRTLARRDVVAAVADASPGGASVQAVEAVATQVMEAAGPPLGRDGVESGRGHVGVGGGGALEPRWSASDVVEALEREPTALSAPGGARTPPLRIASRSSGLDRRRADLVAARDSGTARDGGVARAEAKDRGLVRGRAWER